MFYLAVLNLLSILKLKTSVDISIHVSLYLFLYREHISHTCGFGSAMCR